jgi:acyl-CoA synthetase (AMP-forming)/AMP-acid ligase II
MKYIHEFILNKNNNIEISDKKYNLKKKDLIEKANFLINFFIKEKVNKEFRVLIIMPNSIFIPISIFAISILGGIFSIIDEKTSKNTINKIIFNFKPNFIITSQKNKFAYLRKIKKIFFEKFINKESKKRIKKKISRTIYDVISITYTSGSTGSIKGVVTNHQNLIFSTNKILEFLKYKQVKIGCFLPMSFDYGLYQFFLALKSNSNLYLGNSDELGFNFLNTLKKNNITCLPLVQNILSNFLSLVKRFKDNRINLKIITNTGSPILDSDIKEIKKIYPNLKVFLMYGLTECKRVSILDYNRFPKKINSVGKPLKSTKCWIINKNQKKLPFNKKGELVVEGKNVMMGYFNDKKLSKDKFFKINKDISRLYTGDICKIDKDGFIYFYKRKDDIFKNKNFRISKSEVENDLKDIVGIDDAVVMPAELNFKYTFFIKTKLKKLLLIKKIKRNLDFYKIAERVITLKKIPINNRGKVDKKTLIKVK